MRLSAILVIIVIMMQALIPCSDSFMLPADSIAQHLSTSHDDTHDDIDQCGPFCECSCCSTHTVVQHAADFTFLLTIYKQRYTVITQSEKLGISPSIWQPPRLVV